MIQRSDEPLSASNAAQLFRSVMDPQAMGRVCTRIMEAAEGKDPALNGLDAKDREKLVLEYRRLTLSYGLGRPRQQGETSAAIDLGDLDSTDACLDAMRVIKDAQRDQLVTLEQAEDLRKTVNAALQIHRSQAGAALMDAIEEHGAQALFLGATMTADEAAEEVRNRIAQYEEGASDGE